MKVLVACEPAQVPGYPAYRICSDGKIQSRWRRGTPVLSDEWRDLRPGRSAKGYLGLTICNAEGRRSVRVHRLVAQAFIANPDNLPCVRHLDGDPSNNRVENLAWGTYTDNEADKLRHGTWHARYGGAKLTHRQVEEIRAKVRVGIRQVDVATEYGVSRPTVTRIVNNTIWETR